MAAPERPAIFRRLGNLLLDPQVAVLWLLGLVLVGLLLFLGQALAPFLAAVILAYMLEAMVRRLTKQRVPRWLAVIIVFCFFMTALVGLFLWLIPLVIRQLSALVEALPAIASAVERLLTELHTRYGSQIDSHYIEELIPRLTLEVEGLARRIISHSLTYLPGLFSIFLYLFLVPLLVLLFLKDKERILCWLSQFVPTHRELFIKILQDIDAQMGRFFMGKFWEMTIISGASVGVFLLFNLRFAVLMGLLSGVSVLIPYLGVMLATIPIAVVALFQWGLGVGFWKVFLAYVIIQLIDGNLLAPLLVGQMIHIHAAGIIFAVLVCAQLWGFWGIVFAFPVAIIVKSILDLLMLYIRERSTRCVVEADDGRSV